MIGRPPFGRLRVVTMASVMPSQGQNTPERAGASHAMDKQMNRPYLAWRPRSFSHGLLAAFLPHALGNATTLLVATALGGAPQ